jgi:hypothetical protein
MPCHNSPLVEDLQNLQHQFQAIKTEAQHGLADLSDAQFNWHPSAHEWSIAECIDHLIVTGRRSLSRIHQTVNEARSQGLLSRGPFRYGILEKWMVRLIEPPPRRKFRAPKGYVPFPDRPYSEVVPAFFLLQDEFLECLHESNGIDLSKTKVGNPATKWFKLSLGQYLALHAAHQRRHLWQVRQIKENQSLPCH